MVYGDFWVKNGSFLCNLKLISECFDHKNVKYLHHKIKETVQYL